MTGRLEGKVAIITGAARGQGEAEARHAVAEGASVLLTDVLDAEGEAVAADLGAAAAYRHLDVTSEEEWIAAVADAEERFGPVTVLVNNAGILDFGSIEYQDVEKFRRVIDVNLMGTMIGMKSVTPSMRRAGGGSIINISSNGGIMGLPALGAYVSSKWAVRGLSKTAAMDLGKRGIRVNSLHPGGVDTPMTRLPGQEPNETLFAKSLPMGRFGHVDEIAKVVVFLASDEASYVTGAEWSVDGGATAGDRSLLG
ncbi:MAG: glucose 1-dehydrogenase [Acidimicrobiia bacterium]|nr:glucose 1-dehydrogenase [Acidimicrobiia bacterium]